MSLYNLVIKYYGLRWSIEEVHRHIKLDFNTEQYTGIQDEIIPVPYLCLDCYPNPFNLSTTIAFSLPKNANTKLSVYNINGQKVKDIICGELPKGFHKAVWDGKDGSNRSVSSGIYFFRLVADGKVSVRKAMLMK